MLQRAASNAYSWWWASHIRTKQSKWLDQSLQDIEEKVQHALKLLEEDGDSFAKRAEMYYKKRPELVYFVEESYRAYRALAERYDHLSTELQNANNTIATLCPDEIPLMEDYDECSTPRPRNFPQVPVGNSSNIPKVPKAPIRDWKGLITASKYMNKVKKPEKSREVDKEVPKSDLSKAEAFEEIDKLQKDILALQTVKEFVKSSYESGLSKYWGIENQITEMQERISDLEDEFGSGKVIEDDEARRLMAEAAIKSCQETLAQLQEKHVKSNQEATEDHKKIEVAVQKLKYIKKEVLHDQTDDKVGSAGAAKSEDSNKEPEEMNVIKEKIKEHFEVGSLASLTVSELAEKIDDLVNKVISLETSVSSQTALIERLRTEADDLQNQVRALEQDKATMIDDAKNLSSRLKKVEEKLQGIQDLNRNVEKQNNTLQTHFDEASSSLDSLSKKLNSVMPDEEEPEVNTGSFIDEDRKIAIGKDVEENKKLTRANGEEKEEAKTSGRKDEKDTKENDFGASVNNQGEEVKKPGKKTVTFQDPISKELLAQENQKSTENDLVKTDSKKETEKEGDFNWQQMLLTGVEDKEKILLTEYTEILRNYKDTKKILSEREKKEKDQEFEVALQISDLKSAIAKRDEEIQQLRQRLNLGGEDNSNTKKDHHPASSNDRGVKAEDKDNHLTAEEIKILQPHVQSPVEEKLRSDIDAILDENLEFWLKFSTSYHQIKKFKTTVHDLQNEISKIKEKKQQEGSHAGDVRSEVRPIYKHLKEIQAELKVWLEQSVLLKDELERRFTSLCNIQEKIMVALKEGVEEDEIRFSSHQAAKFHGEILNMKQENTKVKDELQAGVDHVTTLQEDINKYLKTLSEEFELSEQPQLRHSTSRGRIPLRSFIFGTKPKKQRHSIFSSVHPHLRAGYLFRSSANDSIS